MLPPLDRTKEVAATMEDELRGLEEIFNGMLDEVGVFQEAPLNDSSSIHFEFANKSRKIKTQYNAIITHDLEIHGMDLCSGDWEERRRRLQTRLVEEWTYVRLCPDVEEN
ncbi:hypothetical protein ACA910_021785 [Epithemia clementina (nom. ined.)]